MPFTTFARRRMSTTPTQRFLPYNLFVFIIAILLFVLHDNNGLVKGQESPTLNINQFNTSITYRTDVCERHDQYLKGEISFRDALKGLNLSVAMRANQYFQLSENSTSIDEEYAGLTGVLLVSG